MQTIYRNQSYNFEWVVIDRTRTLVDPSNIKWKIYEGVTTPTQIEPLTGWNTLDLVVQKVRTGVYNIPWTVPSSATVGRYWLEVSVTIDSATATYLEEFEVIESRIMELTEYTQGIHLTPLWELTSVYTTLSNETLYRASATASETIEKWCRYVFSPRYVSQVINCTYTGKLDLPQPVCVLEAVKDINDSELDIDEIEYRRHLESPNVSRDIDDRLTPYLKMSVYKNTNYTLEAWTGYTSFNGNPLGETPKMIRQATIRLASAILDGLTDPSSGGQVVKQEKTATQMVEYQDMNTGMMSIVASTIINSDQVLYQMIKLYYRADRISLV